MTILEKIKFEEDWLSEVNLTKENVKIAFAGIRATALEQQPCEDCVSKAEMEKIVGSEFVDLQDGTEEWRNIVNDICLEILDKMNALPSVTPQQTSWIPVSERLPEEDGFYLATCDGEICGEDEPFSGLAEFENGKWTDDEEGYQCVLAWQPLPQPYKAESEDEE